MTTERDELAALIAHPAWRGSSDRPTFRPADCDACADAAPSADAVLRDGWRRVGAVDDTAERLRAENRMLRADRDGVLNERARIRDLWEHGHLFSAIAAMGFDPDELVAKLPALTQDTSQTGETR